MIDWHNDVAHLWLHTPLLQQQNAASAADAATDYEPECNIRQSEPVRHT